MEMKKLADHRDYRITLHPVESAKGVVVTFDAYNTDLADRGFGTDFVMGEGYSNIYVAQRRGTQYQGLSLDAFRDAVLPHCHTATLPHCHTLIYSPMGPVLAVIAPFIMPG